MTQDDLHLFQIALELGGYLATGTMKIDGIKEEILARLDGFDMGDERYEDAAALVNSAYLFGRQIALSNAT